MAEKDFYSILGVSKNASEKEIKQAYRRLARKYHPDVNPSDKQAEARFKEINAAYEVLSDPAKRKKYNTYGERWEQADQFAPTWASAGRRSGNRQQGPFGFGGDIDFEDLFGGIPGGAGHGRQSRPRRGGDIEQRADITLEEAYHGSARILQLQGEEPCSTCRGTGRTSGTLCAACQGLGLIIRPRRLEVKIPPGSADGSRIRVPGEGQAGLGGGQKGDLYLVISVRPHERFECKGNDLYAEISVPLTTAILGGEVHLATLKGRTIAVRIAPETQNGQTIRLAGLGMPRIGSSTHHGDLYVKVKAVLPTNLTAEQKRLVEELQATL